MPAIGSVQTSRASTALYSRLDWRLLPFLLVCYTFAYLDRVNIGFAKLQMQSALGMSDAVYGLGAGVFFLGYVLFEIPSNLLLPKVGARRTISRIMILWGLTSACMMFVHSETSFYIVRFLLGVFEAGFAPGMIFYLTYWYGPARMGRVMAIVMLAGPIGGIVGGPLSAWIMTSLAGVNGLMGWQWMFVLEGLPCVALGILSLFCLTDRPADAKWLSQEDKYRLTQETAGAAPDTHASFFAVVADGRVWLMAVAYFCLICGIYAVSFWLPTILKADGVKGTMQIGWYSAIPYIVSAIAMTILSRSSDRHGERRLHSAIPALVGAVSLAAAAVFGGQLFPSLLFITIATAMIWVAYTIFWAIPSEYLKGDTAAGGMAFINTIGLLGGFLSPTIMGWVKQATGSLQAGLYVMVALLLLGAILLYLNRLPRSHQKGVAQ